MKRIIKQIVKIFFTVVFCLIVCCGCIFDPVIGGGGSGGNTGGGQEEVTACELIQVDSNSSSSSTSTGFKANLSSTIDTLSDVMESTITIYACYNVDDTEYNMQSSGFIIEHDESTNTYYITTSSGIFYRELYTTTSGSTTTVGSTIHTDGEFEILMEDGNRYVAQLVGYSENIDVAIFKFTTDKAYDVVTFGDSDSLQVGDSLYAIGTPCSTFDLYNTVIRGEVSGLHRLNDIYYSDVVGYSTYTDTVATVASFQFDASINGGMEGGPIVNTAGQVVGISTYRYGANTTDYSYESLAFGIAINDVRNVFDSIINDGSFTKPLLGVTVTDLHNVFSSYSWLSEKEVYQGVYVTEIAAGSAAKTANMEDNCVITSINDGTNTFTIENLSCLYSALFRLASKNITVTVINSSGTEVQYSLALS